MLKFYRELSSDEVDDIVNNILDMNLDYSSLQGSQVEFNNLMENLVQGIISIEQFRESRLIIELIENDDLDWNLDEITFDVIYDIVEYLRHKRIASFQ